MNSYWGLNRIKTELMMMMMMFTVSNALLMSKATATVHCGGLGLLKPLVIWWQMFCKTVCLVFMFEYILMKND